MRRSLLIGALVLALATTAYAAWYGIVVTTAPSAPHIAHAPVRTSAAHRAMPAPAAAAGGRYGGTWYLYERSIQNPAWRRLAPYHGFWACWGVAEARNNAHTNTVFDCSR